MNKALKRIFLALLTIYSIAVFLYLTMVFIPQASCARMIETNPLIYFTSIACYSISITLGVMSIDKLKDIPTR